MQRTILIISDCKLTRFYQSELLKQEYNILEAAGEHALALLEENHKEISAIILDIVTPRLDGFVVLNAICSNALFHHIPVIVVTSTHDEEAQEKAFRLGASGFISSPHNSYILRHTVKNLISLRESAALGELLRHDKLTGLLGREAFFQEAEKLIHQQEPGYYVLAAMDIDNFKIINDRYGIETGDAVLKHVAACIDECASSINGLACRFAEDQFAILYPREYMDSELLQEKHRLIMNPAFLDRPIKIRIGRYVINDLSVPLTVIYDGATMAEKSVKGRYDTYIARYQEAMRSELIREQEIVTAMRSALEKGEFEAWFHPQYNHLNGALIGAEALTRWRTPSGLMSPVEFIPIFERNGFIYEMDRYIWDQVCRLQRGWLDAGLEPLPVSVNISRVDLQHDDVICVLKDTLDKYTLPIELLRLEITESAFSDASGLIVARVNTLIDMGFIVEIDDFGSGYSSLNTLKDVPAQVLKLDMHFFENTKNSQRGGNIIESVVRMAEWLDMAVIAEGVENKAQADYQKSIGCYYIQGHYYAKPMPAEEYAGLLATCPKDPKLARLETLATMDNSEFWNPMSMETLIFNSYVGGACIFEYSGGKTQLLRANDQYVSELGCLFPDGAEFSKLGPEQFLDEENHAILHRHIQKAIATRKESTCELKLSDNTKQPPTVEYIRVTYRVIASTGSRYLFYCVLVNTTQMHLARQKEQNLTAQLSTIMANIQGGITATAYNGRDDIKLVFSNEGFYAMYGYTRAQFEAEVPDILSLILPEDKEKTLNAVERIVRRRSADTYEYRCRRRDGSTVWVQASNSFISLEGYGDNVLLAVTSDVTAQREAEQAARIEAAKLETVMNNIGDGITAVILRGHETEFLFANDRFYEIHGVKDEQYSQEPTQKIMALVHPEDREYCQSKINEVKQVGQRLELEYRLLRPDGRIIWVKAVITIVKLPDIDAPVQVSSFSDITNERELKEQLTILSDSSHETIYRLPTDEELMEM